MKSRVSLWICFLLASQIVACQNNAPFTQIPIVTDTITETGQPEVIPLESLWKITGDPNLFDKPAGVAIDSQGNIFVMDTGNSRVQKFDRDGSFILMWGIRGKGEGQFMIFSQSRSPYDGKGRMAVDSDGNVYVIDVDNYRVQKFDNNGNFLIQWGTEGSENGQFKKPVDIELDDQNNVYVVDHQNPIVQKFDSNGKFLLSWGSNGFRDGEFSSIYSLAINPDGQIFVADSRIQEFDSNGEFLSRIIPATITNKTILLMDIAIDNQGCIYIIDNNNAQIIKINNKGEILAVWHVPMFESMEGIAVDEQGNIYVTDSVSNIVQKFRQPAFLP